MPFAISLPRIMPLPGNHFNPDNHLRAAAPPPSALQTFAKSTVGKLLGSHTAKVAAGILIGVGIVGIITVTGGVVLGVALIALGIAAWIASTTVSTAQMSNKSIGEKIVHIGFSLIMGTTGIFGGALTVCGASAALAAVAPKLVAFGEGFQFIGSVAGLLDFSRAVNPERPETSANDGWEDPHIRHIRSLREETERSLAEIRNRLNWLAENSLIRNPPPFNPAFVVPPSTPEVITSLNGKLKEIFNREKHEATRNQSSTGKNVTLHMPKGEDCITYDEIADSNAEWIAVMRQVEPPVYDVMQLSTYETMMTDREGIQLPAGTARHPVSRLVMSDDRTIRGKDLITLLDTPEVEPATEPLPAAPAVINQNEIQTLATIPL